MAEEASPGLQPLGRRYTSVEEVVISTRLATPCLTTAGAMPVRRCRLFMLVGFKQPVIERQVLFNTGSSFLAWDDLSQTGHAYAAEEEHRARAVDLNVCALHLELVSFQMMLFWELTFSLEFSKCSKCAVKIITPHAYLKLHTVMKAVLIGEPRWFLTGSCTSFNLAIFLLDKSNKWWRVHKFQYANDD